MTAPLTHRYIAVEGPIGVGKTSLARRLAERLDAALVLERATENPFLERYYRNPRAAAFPAQLHFLFQRAQQLEPANAALPGKLKLVRQLLGRPAP